jgi:hypothetical protein
MAATTDFTYTLEIEAPANGRVGKATVLAIDGNGKTVHSDRADLTDAAERRKLAKRMAEKLNVDAESLLGQLEKAWNETLDQRRRFRERAKAGSPEAAPVGTVELLDTAPLVIRRPLGIVGGRAFATAWLPLKHTVSQSFENGTVVKHEPPLSSVEEVLLVVAGDGTLYGDKGPPGVRPLAELGLPVRLAAPPPPGRGWSGAGVKRFAAGERPDPADVFRRVKEAVDRFLDFDRSLAEQDTMCELVACYILGTYFLDAFHVTGYLWPSGERGTGKTSLLQFVVELAYLGQLILAGSSYACLRDMADYGATLAFDDAEAIMDVRRTDPDKRTLLLAGNRRGATVALKEQEGDRWVTRYVNTFCPRLFSAINLPDEVLGSRSIIVPLVRSGDPRRSKANCLDPEDWPHDRRRLVDDLWALGLTHLPVLSTHDRRAAASVVLAGRTLDPWRPVLAVAHWLQERHGVGGLFKRMEELALHYQSKERGEYEDDDRTRVLFRVLLNLSKDEEPGVKFTISPGEVAEAMCQIAKDEDLAEPDKPFITARKVGWLMKRHRFQRAERSSKGKTWEATPELIEKAARAFGVVRDPPKPATGATEEKVPF